jgi:superfamily II DNA or RNA helicase
MEGEFRKYQKECDDSIYEELCNNNKCLVKMFCGTGKSLIMRKCKVIIDKNLVVFVFPSLSLITQFYNEYFVDKNNVLNISSESTSTTDPGEIKSFLSLDINKFICVTYQSFNTLLDNLDGMKIDACIFDEAHHAVGETYQKLIFENDVCEKQIFFTATPKNANGIIMYDRCLENDGMCGKLVYDYPYLKGMNEGYLNPFEIRIDMYTENNNKSVYECIARAVLESKNNRVLTFHADVNNEKRDKSVNIFVDEKRFREVFQELQEGEYPTQRYKKITMIGLSAVMSIEKRVKLLEKFDKWTKACVSRFSHFSF